MARKPCKGGELETRQLHVVESQAWVGKVLRTQSVRVRKSPELLEALPRQALCPGPGLCLQLVAQPQKPHWMDAVAKCKGRLVFVCSKLGWASHQHNRDSDRPKEHVVFIRSPVWTTSTPRYIPFVFRLRFSLRFLRALLLPRH